MKRFKKYSKGFTLIELLVVISIIGILATLALASFTNSQRQARDSKRKADLKGYATSLQAVALRTGGFYPKRSGGADLDSVVCTDINSILDPDVPCPSDPIDSGGNVYFYRTDNSAGSAGQMTATQYILYTQLESTTNYWVVCSTGEAGEDALPTAFNDCP